MLMPKLKEIQDKYLILLAEACSTVDECVRNRQSIYKPINEPTNKKCKEYVSHKAVEHFSLEESDNEIENAYKELKEKLESSNEKEALYDKFNDFFYKKTAHKIDTARIVGFSKERKFLSKSLYDNLLLNAIEFTASSKLRDSFDLAFKEANILSTHDDGIAFRALTKNLTHVTVMPLEKLDISCHLELFQQLIELGLGNQPSHILDMLDFPQQFKDFNHILQETYNQIKAHVSAQISYSQAQSHPLLSCFFSKKNNVSACFQQYQTNVTRAAFNFLFSKERDLAVLESQLTQHDANFLSSSGLKSSYPNFQGAYPKLLKQIKQPNKAEAISAQLFSQQQTATGASILANMTSDIAPI
ncbi:hypothetical protein PsalN5692_02947 [Piscirickettsia salmonis]|nr:hypothetical protein PsalN5692_02947 [Piscirickettsia salmonis]